jgi:O-antigen ligase
MNQGTIAIDSPPQQASAKLEAAMLWTLAFFLFSLPLVEAPKNISAVLYVVLWLAYGVRTRNFGGPWNRYDTVFTIFLASALASGLSGFPKDVPSVFRMVLVAWAVSRSPAATREPKLLTAATCIGTVVSIAIAAVPFLRGTKQFLELPSVGHANQSALYIAIMTVAAFAWWLQGTQGGLGQRARAGLAFTAVLCCAALLAGGSRAAAGASAVAAVVIAAAIVCSQKGMAWKRLFGWTVVTVAGICVLVAALGAMAPNLSDRKLTAAGLMRIDSTETRIKHWRLAVEGWRQRPWLGWGPERFQLIKIDDVCRWRQAHGEDCPRERYLEQVHGHSLYFSALAERGVVGVAALALLLAAWAWSLVTSWRTAASSWAWSASASGFLIAVIAGTFNTTMRVEHGALAIAFFAFWIAAYARPGAARSAPPA